MRGKFVAPDERQYTCCRTIFVGLGNDVMTVALHLCLLGGIVIWFQCSNTVPSDHYERIKLSDNFCPESRSSHVARVSFYELYSFINVSKSNSSIRPGHQQLHLRYVPPTSSVSAQPATILLITTPRTTTMGTSPQYTVCGNTELDTR